MLNVPDKHIPEDPDINQPGPMIPEIPGDKGKDKPSPPPKLPVNSKPDDHPEEHIPSLPRFGHPGPQTPPRSIPTPNGDHDNVMPFTPKPSSNGHIFVPQHINKDDLLDMLAWLPPEHHAHILKQVKESNRVLTELESGPNADIAKETHAVAANVGAGGSAVVAAVDASIMAEKIIDGDNIPVVNDEEAQPDGSAEEKPEHPKPDVNHPGSGEGNEQHPDQSQTKRPLRPEIKPTQNPITAILPQPVPDKDIPTKQGQNNGKPKPKPDISKPNADISKEVNAVASQVGSSGSAVVGAVDAALVVDKVINGVDNPTEVDLGDHLEPGNIPGGEQPSQPGSEKPRQTGTHSTQPPNQKPEVRTDEPKHLAPSEPEDNTDESNRVPIVDKGSTDKSDVVKEVSSVASQVGSGGGAVVGAVDAAMVVDKAINGEDNSKEVDLGDRIQPEQPLSGSEKPGQTGKHSTQTPNQKPVIPTDQPQHLVQLHLRIMQINPIVYLLLIKDPLINLTLSKKSVPLQVKLAVVVVPLLAP